LSSFAALERAIRAAACPWFGVDLDPAGIVQDEWLADEVFARLGGLIRHVRGRDAIKGSGQRTQPAIVGEGNVDWSEMGQLLDDAGYQGWVTLDPMEVADRAAGIARGLKRLRMIT